MISSQPCSKSVKISENFNFENHRRYSIVFGSPFVRIAANTFLFLVLIKFLCVFVSFFRYLRCGPRDTGTSWIRVNWINSLNRLVRWPTRSIDKAIQMPLKSHSEDPLTTPTHIRTTKVDTDAIQTPSIQDTLLRKDHVVLIQTTTNMYSSIHT